MYVCANRLRSYGVEQVAFGVIPLLRRVDNYVINLITCM